MRVLSSVCLAPKALPHTSLGHRPRIVIAPQTALKARLKAPLSSISHISFVELNVVSAQQVSVLVLKRVSPMVPFLSLHILQYCFQLARAQRECHIPALPGKASIRGPTDLDPF